MIAVIWKSWLKLQQSVGEEKGQVRLRTIATIEENKLDVWPIVTQ